MIGARLPDGRDVLWDGGFSVLSGDVPARLERPAKAVRAVERVEGGIPVIERVEIVVEPGTAEHARAALLTLGATTFFDDEA